MKRWFCWPILLATIQAKVQELQRAFDRLTTQNQKLRQAQFMAGDSWAGQGWENDGRYKFNEHIWINNDTLISLTSLIYVALHWKPWYIL